MKNNLLLKRIIIDIVMILCLIISWIIFRIFVQTPAEHGILGSCILATSVMLAVSMIGSNSWSSFFIVLGFIIGYVLGLFFSWQVPTHDGFMRSNSFEFWQYTIVIFTAIGISIQFILDKMQTKNNLLLVFSSHYKWTLYLNIVLDSIVFIYTLVLNIYR